jgi:hypothetical protein
MAITPNTEGREMGIYTGFISDADLTRRAHPNGQREAIASGGRVSEAVYADGTSVYWCVGSASHNRIWAREYGARIIGSPLVSCRWVREGVEA